MEAAIEEARAARAFGEHPVGAVIVQGNQLISRSGNRTHRDLNPTHHAEMVAIGLAAQYLGTKNLRDCLLYTTHEPCPMCAAASLYARIGGIIFGTSVAEAVQFVIENPQISWRSYTASFSPLLTREDAPHLLVIGGFMRTQCAALFDLLLTE
jgi:tRNA(Arg) A34 adenosine deaminase TadA